MRKRIGAALLLCLLLSTMLIPPALGAEGAMPPSAAIVVTRVTETDFIEVSLRAEAEVFVSADTVLSFDMTKLRPVDFTGQLLTDNASTGLTTVPTKAADRMALKPALTYKSTTENRACLYLSAGSQNPEAVQAREKLVTVRFRYIGSAEDKAADLAKENFGTETGLLRFAAQGEATRSMVPGALSCTTGIGVTRTVWVHGAYGQTAVYSDLTEVPWEVTDGSSVAGSGGTTTAEAYAVTFLDWDGTILETAAMPRRADISKEAATLQADPNRGLATALAGKPGYDFDCWLNYGAEKKPFTSNLESVANQSGVADLAHIDQLIPVGGDGLTLQAAYKANDTLRRIGGDKPAAYVLDTENIYYTRYGAATEKDGKYSITLTFRRTLEEGGKQVGVQRAVEPGVIAAMTPSAGGLADLFSFVSVENQEAIQVELVPTRDISKVSFYLVDVNGVAAWPNAASRSGSSYSIPAADFIKYGTANYICEQAILSLNGDSQSEWDKYVDAQTFKDALGKAVGNVETAKAAVMTKLKSVKETEGDYRVLTYAEFQQIVSGQ